MPRDYKFFEAARKAALESTFKVKVGAVAVLGGKVIASAASSSKTEPLQYKYNVYRKIRQTELCLPKAHAEIVLLKKLKKMDVPMRDVKIYVYRICKSREHGLARPCVACFRGLVDAGIQTVYYSTDFGFAKEWIDCIDYKEA